MGAADRISAVWRGERRPRRTHASSALRRVPWAPATGGPGRPAVLSDRRLAPPGWAGRAPRTVRVPVLGGWAGRRGRKGRGSRITRLSSTVSAVCSQAGSRLPRFSFSELPLAMNPFLVPVARELLGVRASTWAGARLSPPPWSSPPPVFPVPPLAAAPAPKRCFPFQNFWLPSWVFPGSFRALSAPLAFGPMHVAAFRMRLRFSRVAPWGSVLASESLQSSESPSEIETNGPWASPSSAQLSLCFEAWE